MALIPQRNKTSITLGAFLWIGLVVVCGAFIPTCHLGSRCGVVSYRQQRITSSNQFFAYVPPAPEDDASTSIKKKSLHPKVGDIVRYYDLDGGKSDGEVLVGKISFISKTLGEENSWIVELNELEDVGDGYYAEYPARKKGSKKATRALADVSPIFASFVRSENSFKVPRSAGTDQIQVRAEQYDIDDYEGPFSGPNAINTEIIAQDGLVYSELKGKLLKYAAIAGVAGTLIADLVKGAEDAVIYGCGALASLGYLFFLSLKTDTIGSENAKLGSNVSNLRFIMPVLVVVGIALYNNSLGDANPVQNNNPFDMITTEQFAAAVLGFLTYRLPLFFSQIQDAFKDETGNVALPGSAGVAMQLAQETEAEIPTIDGLASLTPVLVVSGPQATGRSELVKKFIGEGDGRFVEPKGVDSIREAATFERLSQRDEILGLDPTGRSGITAEAILTATKGQELESVVVVDADVELVKKLTKIPGARLIGVWVGLGSVKDFESQLEALVENGSIPIPEDETKESVIRARIREIVQEIEFGISSGIFEFTILNENEEASLKQLRDAANYCFD